MAAMRAIGLAGCAALSACQAVSGLSDFAPGGGGGTASSSSGTGVVEPGCSDGTREAYLGEEKAAGCDGTFLLPGVTGDSLMPHCGRQAGNTGQRPSGPRQVSA